MVYPQRRLQLVLRWRPRLTLYARVEPVTVKRPTPAQAEARLRFAEAAMLARRLGPEKVAELVGGEVVSVEGTNVKTWIRLPDGRILPPQNAIVLYMMRGWRSRYRRAREPEWLQEMTKTYRIVRARTLRLVRLWAEKLMRE